MKEKENVVCFCSYRMTSSHSQKLYTVSQWFQTPSSLWCTLTHFKIPNLVNAQ